jgi:proteic killer suppression protein
MEFRFSDRKLEKLYTEGAEAHKYAEGVVDAFLRRVRRIDAAKDERDLRVPASVHFEKLKGDRAGRYSMRLKDRWRLILRIVTDEEQKTVVIDEITQHYGD